MKASREWDIEPLDQAEVVTEVRKSSRHYSACIASGVLFGAIVAGLGAVGTVQASSANSSTFLVRRFERSLPRELTIPVRRTAREYDPDVDEGFSTSRLARLGNGLFTTLDEDEIADLDIPL